MRVISVAKYLGCKSRLTVPVFSSTTRRAPNSDSELHESFPSPYLLVGKGRHELLGIGGSLSGVWLQASEMLRPHDVAPTLVAAIKRRRNILRAYVGSL